jgi:SpoVK/Ycf46/Vps4 family AAA+-type ATPase
MSPALEGYFSVLDFPFPTTEELEEVLQGFANSKGLQTKIPNIKEQVEHGRHELISAVKGLTLFDARFAFAKSLTKNKRFDIKTILEEKRQIIRKRPFLEFYPSNSTMNDIGGLENLRSWLINRKAAFSQEGQDFGLSKPKGVLLVGVPGTGKSLTAKSISSLYDLPLLRLDFGSLFGSHVGESERFAREAIKLAEALSPTILWADEIEKGLSGTKSSSVTDGGTTSRVVATFLTWMQERKETVFMVCTANDHESIPAAFMRAGRFDKIFFVDIPDVKEREDIFRVLIRRKNKDFSKFNLTELAKKTEGYTGAEIEQIIEEALLFAFNDKNELKDDYIYKAIPTVRPISRTKAEEIETMRNWARETGALFANIHDSSLIVNQNEDNNRVDYMDFE